MEKTYLNKNEILRKIYDAIEHGTKNPNQIKNATGLKSATIKQYLKMIHFIQTKPFLDFDIESKYWEIKLYDRTIQEQKPPIENTQRHHQPIIQPEVQKVDSKFTHKIKKENLISHTQESEEDEEDDEIKEKRAELEAIWHWKPDSMTKNNCIKQALALISQPKNLKAENLEYIFLDLFGGMDNITEKNKLILKEAVSETLEILQR
jgi:hypothetical protein